MGKLEWVVAGAGAVVAGAAAVAALPEIVVAGAAVAVGSAAVGAYKNYQARRCDACGVRVDKSRDLTTLDWTWLAENERPAAEQVCLQCFHQGHWGAQYRRYEMALDAAGQVTTYSARYQGRVPNSVSREIPVAGAWFLEKDDAEKSMKVTAAYLGKNLVTQCKEERRSVGSTPVRSEWRYIGIAGRTVIG
ncbi:hypothetical protein FOZ70_14050 [Burkholderia sp. COPS]|uniref:hypothetical protein n=1 Tax=Burkholderia sp. COPS TaxID=2597663 RepID=UPI001CA47919|nr:hypothetical protein [Burkholderia sp. COPS]MBW5805866.1 hypothetical protein [Burkholderia sp. COPS]